MKLKTQFEPTMGVYYILDGGVPITHDHEHWQSISWVINSNAARDPDVHVSRWVMLPTLELADLAIWAMNEHYKFVAKLSARLVPQRRLVHA